MNLLYEFPVIFYRTFVIWILHQCAKVGLINPSVTVVSNHYFNPYRIRPGCNNIDGLRKSIPVHKKLRTADMVCLVECIKEHRHCLRGSGCLIQQRCIGKRKSGKIADNGLKIKQAFQAALCYFGLVRRILSIPSRIFKNIPENN